MRSDFPKAVIDALARRVGNQCSNPRCPNATAGPHNDSRRAINIGVAAHITAAAPGGPRFDPNLNFDERRSVENGIWLCQNCAKLVDSDPLKFTVALLREWKESAEAAALAAIRGGASSIRSAFSEP